MKLTIIGARPNLSKLVHYQMQKNQNLIKKNRVRDIILHTGQHYDPKCQKVCLRNSNYQTKIQSRN